MMSHVGSQPVNVSAPATRWGARLWPRAARLARPAAALADQTVLSATGFAVGIVLARSGDERELGMYGLGMSLVAGLYAVQGALIATPLALLRQRRTRHSAAAGGTAALLQLTLITAAATAMAIAAGVSPGEWGPVMLATAVASAFLLGRDFVRRLAYAHLRVRAALAVDVPSAVLQLSLVLALAAAGRLTAVTALLALGAGAAAGVVIGLVRMRPLMAWPGGRWAVIAREHWRCGRWIAAAQGLAAANAHGLLWLVAWLTDAASAGAMAACLWIVMLTNPFVYGLGSLLTPRTAEALACEGPRGLGRVVRRATWVLAGATGGFALLLTVAGGAILGGLYGEAYAAHGATAAVLAWGVAIGAAAAPINDGLRAMGRPDAELGATAADSAFTFGLGAVGLAYGGLMGLAWATVAGAAAAAGWQAWLYRRELRRQEEAWR